MIFWMKGNGTGVKDVLMQLVMLVRKVLSDAITTARRSYSSVKPVVKERKERKMKQLFKKLFRIRARDVVKKENNRRQMIFDFSDVERLCNSPVDVIIPSKKGPETHPCWVESCSLSRSEGDDWTHIEVSFRLCIDDILEVSKRLSDEKIEEIFE